MTATRRTVHAFLVVLLLAAPAWAAHGKHEMVMGTVKEITAGVLTVETTDQKTRTIVLDAQTRFERSGAPAKAEDLKAGERVAVEVHTVKGKPTAALVRFGPPPQKPGA
jgi:hypothetical protein